MAQPQSSCKRIVDEESGRPYFVYLVHRPLGDDLEEGSLDILLIDGTQAWAAEGGGADGGRQQTCWLRRPRTRGPAAARGTQRALSWLT